VSTQQAEQAPHTEGPTVAQRRAARRANQTTFNLVLALIASLGIVLFLVVVVVRPEGSLPTVDYRVVGADAQTVDDRFVVPDLPEPWTANRSVFVGSPSDEVVRWETGLLTPEGEFITMVQGLEANESWVAGQLDDARPDDSIRIEGQDWTIYDRRDVDDAGNREYALVTTIGELTVVLYGTAEEAEFETLAMALSQELR
jgi:hypothetical protein